MSEKNRTTVREFAEKHEVTTIEANAFLNFLKHKGIAEVVDQVYANGGTKGRASNVFEIPNSLVMEL